MHLLQDVGHPLLGLFLHTHLCQLALGNGRFIIPLFELLVRQEVLGHDPTDLFEVLEDCQSCVFLALLNRWTEFVKLVIHVEGHLWACTAVIQTSRLLAKFSIDCMVCESLTISLESQVRCS